MKRKLKIINTIISAGLLSVVPTTLMINNNTIYNSNIKSSEENPLISPMEKQNLLVGDNVPDINMTVLYLNLIPGKTYRAKDIPWVFDASDNDGDKLTYKIKYSDGDSTEQTAASLWFSNNFYNTNGNIDDDNFSLRNDTKYVQRNKNGQIVNFFPITLVASDQKYITEKTIWVIFTIPENTVFNYDNIKYYPVNSASPIGTLFAELDVDVADTSWPIKNIDVSFVLNNDFSKEYFQIDNDKVYIKKQLPNDYYDYSFEFSLKGPAIPEDTYVHSEQMPNWEQSTLKVSIKNYNENDGIVFENSTKIVCIINSEIVGGYITNKNVKYELEDDINGFVKISYSNNIAQVEIDPHFYDLIDEDDYTIKIKAYSEEQPTLLKEIEIKTSNTNTVSILDKNSKSYSKINLFSGDNNYAFNLNLNKKKYDELIFSFTTKNNTTKNNYEQIIAEPIVTFNKVDDSTVGVNVNTTDFSIGVINHITITATDKDDSNHFSTFLLDIVKNDPSVTSLTIVGSSIEHSSATGASIIITNDNESEYSFDLYTNLVGNIKNSALNFSISPVGDAQTIELSFIQDDTNMDKTTITLDTTKLPSFYSGSYQLEVSSNQDSTKKSIYNIYINKDVPNIDSFKILGTSIDDKIDQNRNLYLTNDYSGDFEFNIYTSLLGNIKNDKINWACDQNFVSFEQQQNITKIKIDTNQISDNSTTSFSIKGTSLQDTIKQVEFNFNIVKNPADVVESFKIDSVNGLENISIDPQGNATASVNVAINDNFLNFTVTTKLLGNISNNHFISEQISGPSNAIFSNYNFTDGTVDVSIPLSNLTTNTTSTFVLKFISDQDNSKSSILTLNISKISADVVESFKIDSVNGLENISIDPQGNATANIFKNNIQGQLLSFDIITNIDVSGGSNQITWEQIIGNSASLKAIDNNTMHIEINLNDLKENDIANFVFKATPILDQTKSINFTLNIIDSHNESISIFESLPFIITTSVGASIILVCASFLIAFNMGKKRK